MFFPCERKDRILIPLFIELKFTGSEPVGCSSFSSHDGEQSVSLFSSSHVVKDRCFSPFKGPICLFPADYSKRSCCRSRIGHRLFLFPLPLFSADCIGKDVALSFLPLFLTAHGLRAVVENITFCLDGESGWTPGMRSPFFFSSRTIPFFFPFCRYIQSRKLFFFFVRHISWVSAHLPPAFTFRLV